MIRIPAGPLGSLSAIELSRAGHRVRPTELPHPTREASSARWMWLAWIGLAIAGVTASYVPAVHHALLVFLTD